MKKEGIGVIYIHNQLIIMPKVGEKEFEYDEEGMAAAEAEAAETGQDVDQANVVLPDEGTLEEIFEVVAGEEFNEADARHMEIMGQVIALLTQNPELSEALASGDMTVSEFAIKLYRDMEQGQQPE